MRWLFRCSIIAGVAIAAFSSLANAQACGRYYITVGIQDAAGVALPTAMVSLTPITKDETEGKDFVRSTTDPSTFSISYFEGKSFESLHKITASAPGFESAEVSARFISCGNRSLIVRLAKKGSGSDAVWQFTNFVNVDVVDSAGKSLKDVTLTIVDAQNRSEEVELKFGYAYLSEPNGIYRFRFQQPGKPIKEIVVDMTALANVNVREEF